ncbi:MAG: hypothetical protein U5K31_02105 [Balneolaceae bacterium]|nr:hypothetical protein [Balneolaceae bacterium]
MQKRLFTRNQRPVDRDGDFVLYWMTIQRRMHFNYALQRAVEEANRLGKPLLILESLVCDYPWACDRFHAFLLEGMAEHERFCAERGVSYYPWTAREPGAQEGMVQELARSACCVVADEFPVYIIRDFNESIPQELPVRYESVDSNGILPLSLTDKAPYNAYHFRKIVQREFLDHYTSPPLRNPLDALRDRSAITLRRSFRERWPRAGDSLRDRDAFMASLPIDHDIPPLDIKGTRQAALGKLGQFVSHGLLQYDEKHNQPDARANSGLSPWLHFGKISSHEIVETVLEYQPEGWDLDRLTYNKGSTGDFWNGDPNIDGFLDELITWREVGFHYAHHEPDYDQYETLPDWALKTLEKHRSDPREWIYGLEELAAAQTHDEIWNAAQTQLRREGVIHNYLRMLWGKKVIQWTPDPEVALAYLIDLNNRYAIDGRDPNSYSGIFWCFGRFDRAWQERPIFGKVRYMTSESTRRKLKLDRYLERYGPGQSLL